MKLLSASNNLPFIHTLRIALDGENIAHYFSDADMTVASMAGSMTASAGRLYVLHEEDWDRAVALMHELDGASASTHSAAASQPHAARTWPKWLVMCSAALGITLLFVVVSR